jgi:hypothetical protein
MVVSAYWNKEISVKPIRYQTYPGMQKKVKITRTTHSYGKKSSGGGESLNVIVIAWMPNVDYSIGDPAPESEYQ